jgi:alpha-galactosidase/6-phospho-beta-glucosidase family protein
VKIVLIGAGSAQFGLGTLGEIMQSKTLAGSEIALVDIDARALERVSRTAREFVTAKGLPFKISASTDRKEVLTGADFVLVSIEVGNRFELWDQDWGIPLQYGIRQVYGENGGPGGLFHALRITPVIVEICDDVVRLCPDAFVFSYSNPMTAITTTVLRKHPQLKFIGLCHEIASLRRCLPAILGTPFENLICRAAGLNHFSVLLEARYADTGRDAYPDILAKALAFFEREIGYSDIWEYANRTGKILWTEGERQQFGTDRTRSTRPWSDRGLFREILTRFSLLPITVDSHLGEYISWAYDAADHKGILDFYALYKMVLRNEKTKIELKLRERVVPIMEGIVQSSGYEEEAVNILNEGLIPDLPSFIAVEVPALVKAKGLAGVAFPSYPKGFCGLLRNYCGVYDMTAEAVLTGRRDYVVQALLVNPVVDRCARVDELVDIMRERQRPWLDYIT